MDTYVEGGFAYHTTMPTDAIRTFRDVFVESERNAGGFPALEANCWRLGMGVRQVCALSHRSQHLTESIDAPFCL